MSILGFQAVSAGFMAEKRPKRGSNLAFGRLFWYNIAVYISIDCVSLF